MARVTIYKTKADAYALRLAAKRVVRLCLRIERGAKLRIVGRNFDTGRLYHSIHMKVRTFHYKIVGSVGTDVEYARPIHDGSKPHVIRPRRRKGLLFVWPAGIYGLTKDTLVCHKGKVHHPGNRSNRFLVIPLKQESPSLGFRVIASYQASRFSR